VNFVKLEAVVVTARAFTSGEAEAAIHPPDIAQAAIGSRTHAVEARVVGTLADGGPVCASIKPEAVSWALVEHAR
jgi:hypothetical protein